MLVGLVLVIICRWRRERRRRSRTSTSTHAAPPTACSPTNATAPSRRRPKSTDLKTAAKQADCDLRLKLKDEGHIHIPITAATPEYGTNPPTSGNHVEPPYQQADGAYSEMPKEIAIVHTLEHGRMEIQYSPDLPESDQLELKGLYDTMYGGDADLPQRRTCPTRWRRRPGPT